MAVDSQLSSPLAPPASQMDAKLRFIEDITKKILTRFRKGCWLRFWPGTLTPSISTASSSMEPPTGTPSSPKFQWSLTRISSPTSNVSLMVIAPLFFHPIPFLSFLPAQVNFTLFFFVESFRFINEVFILNIQFAVLGHSLHHPTQHGLLPIPPIRHVVLSNSLPTSTCRPCWRGNREKVRASNHYLRWTLPLPSRWRSPGHGEGSVVGLFFLIIKKIIFIHNTRT